MKSVLFTVCCLMVVAYAGVERQKSEPELVRDEFITELIFRGLTRNDAVRIVSTMTLDTVQLMVTLPECFEANDTTGLPTRDAVRKFISEDGRQGFIVWVVSKQLVKSETNGDGPTKYFYEIASTEVYNLKKK